MVFGAVAAAAALLAPGAAPAEQPQEYIVVLKSSYRGSAATVAYQRANTLNANPAYVFEHALKEFVLRLPPSLAERLTLLDSRVAYVERNGLVQASATQSPVTWGLDRIDQRTLPLSGSFSYAVTGAGVTAYVIDTGVRYSHAEGGGRAVFGFDAFGENGADCNGHGPRPASPPRARSARRIRPTGKRPGRTTAAASTGSHRASRSRRLGRTPARRRTRSAARRWRLRTRQVRSRSTCRDSRRRCRRL